jgi:hypothetical protein
MWFTCMDDINMLQKLKQRTVNAARPSRPLRPSISPQIIVGGAVLLLSAGLWHVPAIAETKSVQAPSKTPAPAALLDLLKQMDAAASQKDLNATMKFYGPNFKHADGLDAKTLGEALKNFWQQTQSIQYQTQINEWKAQGPDQYSLETTTTIQGIQKAADRDMKLTSTVRSRVTIASQTITSQEILGEQTLLTTGIKPPVVQVNLPEQVNIGQTFNFDAVVKDPLGNSLLLGSALEEPITPEQYLQRKEVILEPLSSGGLFKVGQAPKQPTRQWISAILIQESGMTIVSQRLNVVQSGAATPKTAKPK